ncbi:tannase/feruloyl esterase family alpha/beta hydrolase [Kordiimonas pumila]|uniref:Tannase/feruloyl esterase family alpha/beta hydrolase n=1 Tax=Kordiimonas pumila TaxID=2161677 RepID=A0ABV7D8H8_9PROT|nr:tannase/feruloyl esterase family alpha/beta hydrolase [Kordiimonas pumila]
MRKHLFVLMSALGMVSTSMAQATEPTATTSAVEPKYTNKCMALNKFSLTEVADVPGRVVWASVAIEQETPEDSRLYYKKRGQVQGAPTPMLKVFPEHCSVEGYMTPNIKFMMHMPPPEKWNGRFLLAACEGWCGQLNEEALMPGLARGYAVVTNDGGHYGAVGFDGVWAYNNVEARIDFAYRANHVVAQAGKALVKEFYGKPPKHSYIAGFSKGGTAGLVSAMRYPKDFDGIFAKAPVPYYQLTNTAHLPWLARAAYPDGENAVMDSSKLPKVHDAVTKACDKIDGLQDGIIDDPRKCDWDPVELLCEGPETDMCLTQPQVESLRKMYAPSIGEKGNVIFPWGTDRGSEPDWPEALYPNSPALAYTLDASRTGLKYMVYREARGSDFNWLDFDYEKSKDDFADMAEIYDASNPDYSEFKKNGGKIIIVHGWGDALISPAASIDWLENIEQKMGGRKEVADFIQLYTVPGLVHGSGGTGPYEFDALTELEKWVEKNERPTKIIVKDETEERRDLRTQWGEKLLWPTDIVMFDESQGTPYRERPIYPYPLISKYKGKGDPNVASSYEPKKP